MAMARMQPSAPRDVFQGVQNSITDVVKEVANQPSVGLCFVQQRVHKAVPGLLALKDVHANTLFKSPWPLYPSLSVLSSSHGGNWGQIRCSSSSSSVWKRSSPSVNASGKAQPIEELWEEYFADPSQWWDNRIDKRNPRSPDFQHKMTRKALWIDGWATPAWVKERLKLGIQGKLQFHVGYGARDPQDIAQSNRLPKKNNGRRNNVPTIPQKFRHIGEGGSMDMQSASTMNEAIAILKTRLQQGFTLDSYMFVEVLKRCLKQKDLKAVNEVRECIIESGMEQDVHVATNLVKVYIRCGRLQDARRVFDELLNKNVFSWTVMIGGYAQHNRAEDAMEVFNQMCQEGVQPNEVTYLSILKAFVTPSALKWGKEVHAHINHVGLESDLRVSSALVHMYAKTGSIDDARLVFDRMEDRNVITWSAMIGGLADHGFGHEAYELLLRMQRDGFKPDAITYVSILNACASAGALEWVKEVHRHVLEAGLESDLRVASALVHMYAKSGSIDDARLVFDRMEDRNVITWNTMIGGLADYGRGHEAYELFLQMQRGDCVPNAITYMSILNACASVRALECVKLVHRHVLAGGLESDLRVGNALVHSYAKSGSIDDARLVFNRMEDRDITTWNMLIGGLADHGFGHEAYELFLRVQREGCIPNAITFVSILNACASAGTLEWVKEVHGHILEAQLGLDLRVGSALVYSYAKSGSIDDARLVFNRMEDRNVITWSAMIGGLVDHGRRHEAYELFLRMQSGGCVPNAITYVSILNASASAGALEWVKEVHRHVLESGLESDLRVGSALVHMYAKNGSIDDARLVFDGMENRNVITWTMLIGGLAQHGRGHEALELFRKMNAAGVKPDECSFVSVLSACSHAGLVDEGCRLFSVMLQDYGIKPNVLHCNCMVDLLGRGGYLEEAKRFIDDMPVEPDGATWGALLGACRTYGNVELGEYAANQVFKLEPKDASPYVLLSNIYAAAGKWEEVSLVRTMMQERGIRKEPGRSWIEVDDKIHDFVVGDTSHPEAKEIYAELDRLTEIIKAEGYIPDTRLVLQNIDEEDKELALCSHSEKLAIAFGLLHTPRGKPIRVYKNLRVCSDCHTATKFISKVTGREIVARDANRFHHFKDGVCSCGDYW